MTMRTGYAAVDIKLFRLETLLSRDRVGLRVARDGCVVNFGLGFELTFHIALHRKMRDIGNNACEVSLHQPLHPTVTS